MASLVVSYRHVTSPRNLLILLIAAALIVRLAWGLSRPLELAADLPDQQEYLSIAKNLAAGKGMQFHDERFNDEVYAFRAPGYPLLLALCGASIRAIRVAQAFIDTSTVLAVYLLTRRLVSGERSEQASLFAAALIAFNPYLIYFSGLILSETLFIALLTWGIVLIMRKDPVVPQAAVEIAPEPDAPSAIPMARRDTPVAPPAPEAQAERTVDIALLAGAVVLALAVAVRPGAMVLPAILLGAAAWATGRRIVPQMLLGAAVTVVVMFPWAYRNHRVLGAWVWTTTNAGHTAYDGFGPRATGASDLRDLRVMGDLKKLDEVARDRVLAESAKVWLRSDLVRSAKLAVIKIGRTWSPMPLSQGYGTTRNVIVGLAYSLPLFALTLAGTVLPAIPVRVKVLCLIPAIYFTAVVTISVGSLRYRIPAEPPMAVLAASVFRRTKAEG